MQIEARFLRGLRVLIVTVLLGGLLFVSYHRWVVPPLYRFYTHAFYSTRLADATAELNVRVDVPLHLSPLARRWIYVVVQNNGAQAVEDLRLWVDWRADVEGGASPSDGVLLLPHLFGEQVAADSLVRFERIEPHSVVSGRMPVYVTRAVTFMMRMSSAGSPSDQLDFPGGPLLLSVDTPRYLVHSLLEHILLPPWSNGFLIAATLIVCGIVDETDKKETAYYWKGWFLSAFWVFLRSLRFILYLLAVILVPIFRYPSFVLISLLLVTVTLPVWLVERPIGESRARHMKPCESPIRELWDRHMKACESPEEVD